MFFFYHYREITRRAKLRNRINPLDINETEFKNRYRLNKEAFKFLCEQLQQKTALTSSSRISLELKVPTLMLHMYTYSISSTCISVLKWNIPD